METKNIANGTKTDSPGLVEIMDTPRPVVSRARDFPGGYDTEFHEHERAQFLYASSGVMTVNTRDGIWVVPPLRAVWIPARTRHQIGMSGRVSMRTLYIDPACCPAAPDHCCVISVSPLLRELVLAAMDIPRLYAPDSPEERIMTVILDQIRHMDVRPLNLAIPREQRLNRIFTALSENPGDRRTLTDWGNEVGATRRTLTRLFQAHTGMSFGQWRQQIRILASLKQLGENEPVTSVAMNLGYNSPSAFISMFKKALGKTPGQYFEKG